MLLRLTNFFCLASNVNDVFVLPKRCFASAQEVDAVRAILTASSRNFKQIGKDFNGADIKYEKKAISSVMIDGVQFPIPDMEPPGSTVEAASRPTPLVIEGRSSPSNIPSNSNNSIDSSSAGAENQTLSYPVSQALESSLKTGLEVEVLYLSGEIAQAEKIYFFRKRLVLLGVIYITLALLMPINFLALGYVWNLPQATEVVLSLYQHFVLLLIPIYIGHAVSIYWNIMQRTKVNDAAAQVFVFQLTEEGCGVRTGERYVVLAWWHFEECWETDEQLMLLLGSRGRTMFVIPKRAFPDRLGLAYSTNLLQRKIKRYKVLA